MIKTIGTQIDDSEIYICTIYRLISEHRIINLVMSSVFFPGTYVGILIVCKKRQINNKLKCILDKLSDIYFTLRILTIVLLNYF